MIAKTLEAMGLVSYLFGAMVLAVVALSAWSAWLRARGPWTKLERRLAVWLCVLAGAFPLVGLFGTIAGLIGAFRALGTVSAAEKQSLLSQGISDAMNCTAIGLALAVPAGAVAIALLVTGAKRDPNRRPGAGSG